jgi:hypothetical protein
VMPLLVRASTGIRSEASPEYLTLTLSLEIAKLIARGASRVTLVMDGGTHPLKMGEIERRRERRGMAGLPVPRDRFFFWRTVIVPNAMNLINAWLAGGCIPVPPRLTAEEIAAATERFPWNNAELESPSTTSEDEDEEDDDVVELSDDDDEALALGLAESFRAHEADDAQPGSMPTFALPIAEGCVPCTSRERQLLDCATVYHFRETLHYSRRLEGCRDVDVCALVRDLTEGRKRPVNVGQMSSAVLLHGFTEEEQREWRANVEPTLGVPFGCIVRPQSVGREYPDVVVTSRVAPFDAEAYCAWMCTRETDPYSLVVTDDSDAIVFGAPLMLGCLNRAKEFIVSRSEIERASGLSGNELVAFAAIVGCDYSRGIHGLGGEKLPPLLRGIRERYGADVLQQKDVFPELLAHVIRDAVGNSEAVETQLDELRRIWPRFCALWDHSELEDTLARGFNTHGCRGETRAAPMSIFNLATLLGASPLRE